eukprot:gene7120-14483_t
MQGNFMVIVIVFYLMPNSSAKPTETAVFDHRKDYITNRVRSDANLQHDVILAVKQQNLDILHNILMEVSDPTSDEYGNYLTSKQVAELTSNINSTLSVVNTLSSYNISIQNQTLYGEFISARGSIADWEHFFSTEFFDFYHITNEHPTIPRAFYYTLPEVISEHISGVFSVVHLPLFHIKSASLATPILLTAQEALSGAASGSYITPSVLNSFYRIFSNTGSASMTQTIYSSISQYFSSTDLEAFQTLFNIPLEGVDADPNNRDSPSACVTDHNSCTESNLDVQYMTAVAQNTYTTIIYDDGKDVMVNWITSTANQANPSKVISISYGYQESDLVGYSSYYNAFNTQAKKLGVMGVTIVVSSGDDGAPGSKARDSSASCGYDPPFPASSPYVLAVGATMGPESGATEVVCEASIGGITSGGGFSRLMTSLVHQKSAINKYFSTVATKPKSGYVTGGRGLPDVSLAGSSYYVIIGGKQYSVSGTSASAPAVAGMISLVNAARADSGLSSLGFLNPAIYYYNGSFANDITSGHNKCTVTTCCTQGYYSAVGWDPATGFGSVDFTKFYDLFSGEIAPTSQPTRRPTTRPTPTRKPTVSPSRKPTVTPSLLPTMVPSMPTVTPTAVPSRPTVIPTAAPSKPTFTPTLLPSRRPTVTPSTSKPSTYVPTTVDLPPASSSTRSPTKSDGHTVRLGSSHLLVLFIALLNCVFVTFLM